MDPDPFDFSEINKEFDRINREMREDANRAIQEGRADSRQRELIQTETDIHKDTQKQETSRFYIRILIDIGLVIFAGFVAYIAASYSIQDLDSRVSKLEQQATTQPADKQTE